MCHLGMLAGKGRNFRNCRVYRLRGDGSNHPLTLATALLSYEATRNRV